MGGKEKKNLSDLEYATSLKNFDRVISAATAVSQGAAGRSAPTSRHFYASLLFTRLCTNGVSVLYVAPRSRLVTPLFEHWDFVAIASLIRNLIECYLAFYYIGVEEVENDAWDCRWNIFNLHDCLRRRKMFENFGISKEELDAWDKYAEEIRGRLVHNSFFNSLKKSAQSDYMKAKNAYLLNQNDLIERMGLDAQRFRGLYIFLSSQVHSYPLGFYRTGNGNRGRGLENEVDKGYIGWMLRLATYFIRRATKEMVALFPNSDRDLSTIGREAIFEATEDDLDINLRVQGTQRARS